MYAPIASISGYRCFVSFIDDTSKCTWVHPMKAHDDILVMFKDYLNYQLNIESAIDGGGKSFIARDKCYKVILVGCCNN